MSEKYWYQDGATVFRIILFGAVVMFFYYSFRQKVVEEAQPRVILDVTGRIEQPFLGSPALVITVWHQHTAPFALVSEQSFDGIGLVGYPLPHRETQ